jgi:hypothetical protein
MLIYNENKNHSMWCTSVVRTTVLSSCISQVISLILFGKFRHGDYTASFKTSRRGAIRGLTVNLAVTGCWFGISDMIQRCQWHRWNIILISYIPKSNGSIVLVNFPPKNLNKYIVLFNYPRKNRNSYIVSVTCPLIENWNCYIILVSNIKLKMLHRSCSGLKKTVGL